MIRRARPSIKLTRQIIVTAVGNLLAGFILAFASCATAANFGMWVAPQFGEFVDAGQVSVYLAPDSDGGGVNAIQYRFVCDPRQITVERTGNAFKLRAVVERGAAYYSNDGYTRCAEYETVGELAVGDYTLVGEFIDRSGALIQRKEEHFTITPAGGKCATDPSINQVIALHKTLGANALWQARSSDPAMADLLGHPTSYWALDISTHSYAILDYPPLESLIPIANRMVKSNQFLGVELNSRFCYIGIGGTVEPLVEYHNVHTNHYFYTTELPEMQAIERGRAGPGWTKTNQSFGVMTYPNCPVPDPGQWGPVYRFYAPQSSGGSNTHFLTVSREECHAVKTDIRWRFESTPFWAAAPRDGRCASGFTPVHRLYNGRWRENDSNHRYTIDPAVVQQMVAQGWRDEGVVMCVDHDRRW